MALLALIQLDDFFRVDGQLFVRVDDNAKQARICLMVTVSIVVQWCECVLEVLESEEIGENRIKEKQQG